MLQLAVLRSNPEMVKERLAIKHFKDNQLVDDIILLDDERRKLNFQFDETKSKINSTSKEIGQYMAKSEKEAADEKKKTVEILKSQITPIQEKLNDVEKKLQELLISLPNLPSVEVPKGLSAGDNEVIRTGGNIPELLYRTGSLQKDMT
jgi:seryl-tRNA synthetase